MWFKRSSVQLSAAVVLALTTKDYITAGIFFTLGIFERIEEERIEQVERRIDRIVDNEIKDLLSEVQVLHRCRLNLKDEIDNKLRKVVESVKNLD